MNSMPAQMQIDGDWAITQKAPVNTALDQRFVMGVKGMRVGTGHANDWILANNQP